MQGIAESLWSEQIWEPKIAPRCSSWQELYSEYLLKYILFPEWLESVLFVIEMLKGLVACCLKRLKE